MILGAETSARETRRLTVIYDTKHVKENPGAVLKRESDSDHAK